ncbi:MAG: ferrous iron transport protein A [Flavobacteriaceae bacterium]|nr:MAG: ferrous iron transport protein A [Flavobacteriaceae bacterium]
MVLSNLEIGRTAKIKGYLSEDLPTKILELGLIPGATVRMKCQAPLNGPVYVSLESDNSKLAIKKSIAELIDLEQ